MTDVNVLVVFYSRYGDIEKLALAAGVGAVQARANIRLRRLPDLADPAVIDADARWKENRERMAMDYVAPREDDPEWADVFLLASPADTGEMVRFLGLLKIKPGAQRIAAPIAAPIALTEIYAAAALAGLIVVPCATEESAEVYGRRVAQIARQLKSSD